MHVVWEPGPGAEARIIDQRDVSRRSSCSSYGMYFLSFLPSPLALSEPTQSMTFAEPLNGAQCRVLAYRPAREQLRLKVTHTDELAPSRSRGRRTRIKSTPHCPACRLEVRVECSRPARALPNTDDCVNVAWRRRRRSAIVTHSSSCTRTRTQSRSSLPRLLSVNVTMHGFRRRRSSRSRLSVDERLYTYSRLPCLAQCYAKAQTRKASDLIQQEDLKR